MLFIMKEMNDINNNYLTNEFDMDLVKNNSKKRRSSQPIPESAKDEAYWERRRRNNESAKKSREIRRARETATTNRVNLLENENVRLRAELETLREEITHLRAILYGTATSRKECQNCQNCQNQKTSQD